MHNPDLLNVAQAASEMDTSVRTVHRLIQSKKLKATKLGGSTAAYVIERSEMDRFIRERDKAVS